MPEHLFLDPEVQTTDAPIKLMHHPARQAYYLTLTDSPWRRSRDWLKWAGSPNTADEAFIRLPKRLWFLYFLIRPLRLLQNAISGNTIHRLRQNPPGHAQAAQRGNKEQKKAALTRPPMFWRSGGPGTVSYKDGSSAPVIPRAGSSGLAGIVRTLPAREP